MRVQTSHLEIVSLEKSRASVKNEAWHLSAASYRLISITVSYPINW